jgi:hypothetical protein
VKAKLLAVGLVYGIAAAVVVPGLASRTHHHATGVAVRRVVVLYQGHGAHWWAKRAVRARRQANHSRGLLLDRRRRIVNTLEPVYERAAKLAAIAYDVDAATLIRKGRCESADWTRFTSSISSAEGPWQFLTRGMVRRYGDHELVDGGTWATTPFWAYSPYDPYAAALAAAWMHSVGRGGEWVCQ